MSTTFGIAFAPAAGMFESESIAAQSTYPGESIASREKRFFNVDRRTSVIAGIQRRWRRERRRRKVGRAYDMAIEVARVLPHNSRVLDVGCGNGFIAHHLSAMLGADAIGIDLTATTEASIHYRQFDGRHFPTEDQSVDAVLLCYVLHHAQDFGALMSELRRVLSAGGLAVIYEDIPESWWDRFVCWTHNLKWRGRTGVCTFRLETEWRNEFDAAGFEIVKERQLSRSRNFAHPVRRRFYLLRIKSGDRSSIAQRDC